MGAMLCGNKKRQYNRINPIAEALENSRNIEEITESVNEKIAQKCPK